jgi:hypothetical protein
VVNYKKQQQQHQSSNKKMTDPKKLQDGHAEPKSNLRNMCHDLEYDFECNQVFRCNAMFEENGFICNEADLSFRDKFTNKRYRLAVIEEDTKSIVKILEKDVRPYAAVITKK